MSYNNTAENFPNNIIAGMFNFELASFLEIESPEEKRDVPEVSFTYSRDGELGRAVNFFEAQDQARRATRWLVLVYISATVLIVIGVTAIVGFALFGTTQQAYTQPVGQAIAANSPILLLTAGVQRPCSYSARACTKPACFRQAAAELPRSCRRHAGSGRRPGPSAQTTQERRRGNGDRLRRACARDLRPGGREQASMPLRPATRRPMPR